MSNGTSGGSLAAPAPRPPGNARQPSQDPQDGNAGTSSAAASGGGGGGGGSGPQTNVDQLMDAVGASGVDIGAEEEGLRATNERLKAQQLQQNPNQRQVDRSREQTFIAPDALANVVKKIAAAFQLRTLEPDTIPLIALATRHRLSSLINDAIAARDHRRFGSHLRPPPFTSKNQKRKRQGLGEDDDDEGADEDEEADAEDDNNDDGDDDELFDFDFTTGQLVTKPKTEGTGTSGRKRRKGKNGLDGGDDALEPAWDAVVFDDSEKLLGVLERVDREEERKKRRERMLRDQKEEEERALAEAIAASEAAEREAQGEGGSTGGAATAAGNVPGTPASGGPSTPRPAGAAGGEDTPVVLDKNGKPKKPSKKKKVDGATPGGIKNMSEDVTKRLTNQTAMRSLGRKQFSWLSGAGGGAGGGGFGSPSPATGGSLPRPKFAPASSLPPPTFATPGNSNLARTPGADLGVGLFSPLGSAGGAGGLGGGPGPSALSRLAHVPALHDANRAQRQLNEWEASRTVVEREDLLFVLDRERGAGVGRGSGRNVLLRGQAGIIKR